MKNWRTRHKTAGRSDSALLHSRGMGDIFLSVRNGVIVLLLAVGVCLNASPPSSTDSPRRFDYTLYYEARQQKQAARQQRSQDLQTFIAALISLSEGRGEIALQGFQAAAQSEWIKKFVDANISGGMDELIRRCKTVHRPAPQICSACDGAGLDICPHCRGVGASKDGRLCENCQGLGAKTCPVCGGNGIVRIQETADPDGEALEVLLVKALCLKAGGPDVFTQ